MFSSREAETGRWSSVRDYVQNRRLRKAGAETNYYRELADLTSSYVNLELVECGAAARSRLNERG